MSNLINKNLNFIKKSVMNLIQINLNFIKKPVAKTGNKQISK